MEGVIESVDVKNDKKRRRVFGRVSTSSHEFLLSSLSNEAHLRSEQIISLKHASVSSDDTFFEIVSPKGRFLFRSQSAFESRSWVRALEAASLSTEQINAHRDELIRRITQAPLGAPFASSQIWTGEAGRDETSNVFKSSALTASSWKRVGLGLSDRTLGESSSSELSQSGRFQGSGPLPDLLKGSAYGMPAVESIIEKKQQSPKGSDDGRGDVYGAEADDDQEEEEEQVQSCQSENGGDENVYGASSTSSQDDSNVYGASNDEDGDAETAHAPEIAPSLVVAGKDESFAKQSKKDASSTKATVPFNELFQRLLEQVQKPFDEAEKVGDRLAIMEELMELSNDFVACVSRYGKVIISEHELPVEQKTIKPTDMGGVIGGQKYCVLGILFKFAIDAEGVLGSDYAAAKVAGLEMSGVASCLRCHIPGIHYPLTALLDYKGFRLIGSSLLDLGKDSLVYGSKNGGLTVLNSHPPLNARVRALGRALNVKPHAVLERSTNRQVEVYTAADVEGHLDRRGRFFMLDLSRTLPPCRPLTDTKNAYLFQHFRPQFVQSYPLPLCSDGYSRFVAGSEKEQEHKREINAATEYLLTSLIPRYGRDLSNALDAHRLQGQKLSSFRLTEHLHGYGINVRYLGIVYEHCPNVDYGKYLMAEMMARVLKNVLRERMRLTLKQSKVPLDEPCRFVNVELLNEAFSSNAQSLTFFSDEVVPHLVEQFHLREEIARKVRACLWAPASGQEEDFRLYMIERLVEMQGLHLDNVVLASIRADPSAFDQEVLFDSSDVLDLGQRVKHLDVLSAARAYVQRTQALAKRRDGNHATANRMYANALKTLKVALNNSPTDLSLLLSIGSLSDEMGRPAEAEAYYLKALQADPSSSDALHGLSVVKEKMGDLESANELLLEACALAPNNVTLLQRYARMNADIAGAFSDRVAKLRQFSVLS